MTTLTMERPQVVGRREAFPDLWESLIMESLKEKLGVRRIGDQSIPAEGVSRDARQDEDTWDEPEGELTRAMNRSLERNQQDTKLPASLAKMQTRALRENR